MKLYWKILSILYGLGAVLHGLDLFDLRLIFSEMSLVWKSWTLFLFIADIFVCIGLWINKAWGRNLLFFVILAQLIAYLGFQDIFGNQLFLIGFHILTILSYFVFCSDKNKKLD